MSIPQGFKKLSFIFSVIVALEGCSVLIGWIANITFLKSISPHWISMKANAAICFLLAGITLILVSREKVNVASKRIVALLSGIIFITGAVTLLEYIFKFNAGIDEFLFSDDGGTFPELPRGRQSLFSAAYFMLFGFCYLPGIKKMIKTSLFQTLHIASGIFVLASLMSYVFGSYVIAGVSLNFIHVIHSTLSFLLLVLAVLFLQPEAGIMKLVSSDTQGGKVIRKTLPLFVFIFIVIGWLRLKGEQAGFYNREFGNSIFIIAMILIMGYLIFSSAASFIKSEQRLIQTNKSLELAEQQANLGNWEFEVRSQFSHWSKQMFRLFELEPTEKAPSYEEFLELIHPDDRSPIMMVLSQLLEQNDKKNIVFRTNPKKISLKYFLPTWHVVKDNKGRPIKYFGTLQDITERIEARRALKQREELFSKAFHSKVFGLAIVDQERQVVDINETLTRLIGYSREEMIGRTSLEIGMTDPAFIKKRNELLLLLLQKGNIENYELELVNRHGKPLTLILSVEPLNLNNHSHWLISLVDITEKRKAEKELAESEQRLNRAEKMGNLGHGYFDVEKNQMQLSAGLYKIFGLAPEKFSHTIEGLKSVIHPGDNLIQEEAVDKLITEGSVEIEFRILRPDGEVRNVFFKTALTKNDKGEFINSFTTALDVTESKKAEEQIKTYNIQLRQLAANLQNIREEERRRIGREIHDELGQLLTVLKMKIARLKEIKNDEKSLDESIIEMLKQAEGCINSSRKISTELRPSVLDDLGLIAGLEWQAYEFGKRTRIRTTFKTNLDELKLSQDYAIAIFRIFQESLTNVARHAEATKVTSTLFIEKGDIVLKIIDNGKGFDTALASTTKSLGLVGMKERALVMNGTYAISSKSNMGTEITVTIPLPAG